MKTLKKFHVIDEMLGEFPILTIEERRSVTGGGDQGIDGLCFFECCEYLSQRYGCNHNEAYYEMEYIEQYGTGSLFGGGSGIKGVESLSYANDFIDSHFNVRGISAGGPMIELCKDCSTVLAVIEAPSTRHAVVIKGYKDGSFNYYDPQAGTSGKIELGKVIMGWGISSCK